MVREAEVCFKLPVEFKKRKKWYVASCPILDVVTQGETKKKAKANLKEALSVFLETCIEAGTLSDVLSGCGFRASSKAQATKTARITRKTESTPNEFINVPLWLFSDKKTGHKQCHA